MKIQAAAISMQGIPFAIALVGLDLVQTPSEADMAIDSLQPHFGGVPVVLMAQREDGTPVYYGDSTLLELLQDVPVDKMPWQEYSFT